ncbi:helix-turn-helix transcriptional regulator, partial [Staphylococcus hominis]
NQSASTSNVSQHYANEAQTQQAPKTRKVIKMWDKIKQQLDKQGITEYRLAKMTGISPQQLHQIKKRNTKNPKWLTVVKITEALGVSLDEFK